MNTCHEDLAQQAVDTLECQAALHSSQRDAHIINTAIQQYNDNSDSVFLDGWTAEQAIALDTDAMLSVLEDARYDLSVCETRSSAMVSSMLPCDRMTAWEDTAHLFGV